MSKRQKMIVGLVAVALFGFIVYSTVLQASHEYEVCVNYKGRSHCATAAGRTAQEAINTGHQVGCALITNGRDENMACLAQAPASTRQVK
ncbi:MAG: hypothetical protein L0Z53_00480 [Acidobacteriales bacterium]|nr:hypothetical protein [Terriglobales bacterium]